MSLHENPGRGHAVFYIHPDWRKSEPIAMIRGEAKKEEITHHSDPREIGVLNHTFQLMQSFLDQGGALSSGGRILTPHAINMSTGNTPHVFETTTGARFHKRYPNVDLSEHDIKPSEHMHIWTSKLKEGYETFHFNGGAVRPDFIDQYGNQHRLVHLSEAFGAFIQRHYDKIGVHPTYVPKAIARCFMIEILEDLKARLPKQSGTQRPQPKRLHSVRH